MPPTRVALVERVALALHRLGVAPAPFPGPFFDAYLAPMAARAITVAGTSGVFDALPDTTEGVAQRTGLSTQGAEVLLPALETLGYVRFRRGRWSLTRQARRWVGPAGAMPVFSGAFAASAWDLMSDLEAHLRGAAPAALHDRPPGDPWWASYEPAMAEIGRVNGDRVAKLIPAERPRRLLDLAGGPGLYAAAMVRRHPGLEATVVELEAAARHAETHPGVRYLEGDLFEVDPGSGYDVVTAHSILHNLSEERCVALLRRARGALRDGGTFAALETEQPEPGHPRSMIAALGSLTFHAAFGTRSKTGAELEEMLRTAGFSDVRLLRPLDLNGSVLAVGTR
ncbi:MAG: hypothetical protein AVDCRST_MAG85-3069 [uncultured Solirubrobacteraceae bacterium]|uniref:O-methyltransferase C-terminal domain-containing protein n=1 Tax=uncultured Solirubrobacteraceae bacterium TaxID=1162706 RepID=A0A6J4TIC3_9ACTN|nr:MAG: hypothetical protein AVDCRST_MAG85-3069 [uncultured Solirubrobacteraceae bacterium]